MTATLAPMQSVPADHYTFRVVWSPEDGEHVGLVAEFPSLSWLDPDATAAFVGIRTLVADVVADLRSSGERVPEPLSDRAYSGRFVVRVAPEVHRRLVVEAAEAGVSLNLLVATRLAATRLAASITELADETSVLDLVAALRASVAAAADRHITEQRVELDRGA